MKSDKPRILVVGSLNVDWIARVRRLPDPGQTVAASSLLQKFGGKGANQAIAAARNELDVSLIGCVGDDPAGASYQEHLILEGIDVSGISIISGALTGTAMIAVDETGENQIISGAGANGMMKPEHVCEDMVAAADVVLLQWEVPQPVVLEALRLAARHEVPAVVNPSPWQDGFPWGTHPIHTLIVNEGEAEAIFGRDKLDDMERLQAVAESHRISRLVITRGSASTLGISSTSHLDIPALYVAPVDTVGAGDAFAGSYAACLARGMDFSESLRHANAAGALATLERGAQEAIPHLARIEEALRLSADVLPAAK